MSRKQKRRAIDLVEILLDEDGVLFDGALADSEVQRAATVLLRTVLQREPWLADEGVNEHG